MEQNERRMRDIAALNQQILLIAREVAEHNPTQAAIQFGLDEATIEALPAVDAGTIVRLAQQPVLVFSPRIPADILSAALDAAKGDDEQTLRAVSDYISLQVQ